MKVTLEDRQKFYFNYFRKIDFTKYDVDCFVRTESNTFSYDLTKFNPDIFKTINLIQFRLMSKKYTKYIIINLEDEHIRISIHKSQCFYGTSFMLSKNYLANDIFRKKNTFEILNAIDDDMDKLEELNENEDDSYHAECIKYNFGFDCKPIEGSEVINAKWSRPFLPLAIKATIAEATITGPQ